MAALDGRVYAFGGEDAGGAVSDAVERLDVAAGTWSHLALVADGKTLQIYLNGAPYASLDGSLPTLTTPLDPTTRPCGLTK